MMQKTSASRKNKKSNEIKTKMNATRAIIRNKFKAALTNRLKHENN